MNSLYKAPVPSAWVLSRSFPQPRQQVPSAFTSQTPYGKAPSHRVPPINIYGRHAHPHSSAGTGAEQSWAQSTRHHTGSQQKPPPSPHGASPALPAPTAPVIAFEEGASLCTSPFPSLCPGRGHPGQSDCGGGRDWVGSRCLDPPPTPLSPSPGLCAGMGRCSPYKGG